MCNIKQLCSSLILLSEAFNIVADISVQIHRLKEIIENIVYIFREHSLEEFGSNLYLLSA
jgi:hypothetical protein